MTAILIQLAGIWNSFPSRSSQLPLGMTSLTSPHEAFRKASSPCVANIHDDALYAHFVTFSVTHRRGLLDHEHPRRIVLGVLNSLLIQTGSLCVGFVLMSEHVHAIAI